MLYAVFYGRFCHALCCPAIWGWAFQSDPTLLGTVSETCAYKIWTIIRNGGLLIFQYIPFQETYHAIGVFFSRAGGHRSWAPNNIYCKRLSSVHLFVLLLQFTKLKFHSWEWCAGILWEYNLLCFPIALDLITLALVTTILYRYRRLL